MDENEHRVIGQTVPELYRNCPTEALKENAKYFSRCPAHFRRYLNPGLSE